MTDLLNIILTTCILVLRLLGYRIEFSCLYIPKEHYFISTCGYEVPMKMGLFVFNIKRKSTSNSITVHLLFCKQLTMHLFKTFQSFKKVLDLAKRDQLGSLIVLCSMYM